jgi:hypothetical protein
MARRTKQPLVQPPSTGRPEPEPEPLVQPDVSPQSLPSSRTRLALALSLLLLLVSLALPAGPSHAELGRALLTPVAGAWPDVARLAAWLTTLTLGLAALGLWRGTPWLVAAGLLGLLSARVHELADPTPLLGYAEPLRDGLVGLTPVFATTLVLAGLWTLHRQPDHTQARWTAALGALGLWLHAFLPVGWVGSATVPFFASLTQLPVVFELPTTLAGPVWVFTQGLVSTALLVHLAGSRKGPAWLLPVLAGLAGLLPCLWALRQGPGVAVHTLAALGLGATALRQLLGESETREGFRRDPQWTLPTEAIAVAGLVAVYLLLKVNGLRYSTTDEALYYYAGKAWSEGLTPYRDFFFSHPPLHIAAPALAYKLLGYHFLVGKWLSALAALGAGLAAWRIARRHLGIWQGVAALAFHLLACEVLQASTNLTGINLTACWLMWGLWAASSRRFLLAGLLLGAAASTGFYAIGGFLTVAVLALALPSDRPAGPLPERLLHHPAVRITLGFLLVWGVLNLYFWKQGGDGFIDGVYEYHFAKKAKIEGYTALGDSPLAIPSNAVVWLLSRDFQVTFYYHAAQFWLALLAPLTTLVILARRVLMTPVVRGKPVGPSPWALLWNPRRWWLEMDQGGLPLWIWTVTLALVVEFAQFKERYDFYYALLIPGLAICAAAWLHGVAQLGRMALDRVRAGDLHGSDAKDRATWLAAAAVLVSMLWVPLNNVANTKAFPSEFTVKTDSKGAGERLVFAWEDAPGPAWLSGLTQGLFWAPARIRGNLETGVHHYLWNKKRWFSTADEIAAYIRDHSQPQDTITGASDYAPLLALLSGRRLAGNQVDTNSKVFNTGAVPLEKFWDAVCADHVKFLIAAPMSYFAPDTIAKRGSVIDNFERVQVFHDKKLKQFGKSTDIELWQRKAEPPQPACSYRGKRGVGPTLDGDREP